MRGTEQAIRFSSVASSNSGEEKEMVIRLGTAGYFWRPRSDGYAQMPAVVMTGSRSGLTEFVQIEMILRDEKSRVER